MSQRIHNFNAGPAVLPEPVLERAREAIWDVEGSGMGILEHSHRGKLFERVITDAEAEARRLASIPEEYAVLFVQGGASQQFAMVPMNLLPEGGTADYLLTGVWSEKAAEEAKKFGTVHVAGTTAARKYTRVLSGEECRYSAGPAYVHLTTNNTIYGTQWRALPPVPDGVPLVADASSDIMSRPIDVARHGLIYAGAQKNIGPSGIVLVIVRKDLLERAPATLPAMLQYRTFATERSLYNTPPTFAIWLVGEVLKWISAQGGLAGMAARNEAKARLLYDFLDQSGVFRGTAERDSRSRMNVCFRCADEPLEGAFLAESERQGFAGLKGHRAVGGMRASIYNACPPESVTALVELMREFERTRG
jgi:phosphoserine aminotransferase